MYLFIATIFIAELIIAGSLIIFLIKLDRKVREMNNRVIIFKPVLKGYLKALKKAVYNFQNTFESFFKFLKKKRQQFITKVIIAIVMYASLIFLRGKFKKTAAVFQTLVLLKDYWDELMI